MKRNACVSSFKLQNFRGMTFLHKALLDLRQTFERTSRIENPILTCALASTHVQP